MCHHLHHSRHRSLVRAGPDIDLDALLLAQLAQLRSLEEPDMADCGCEEEREPDEGKCCKADCAATEQTYACDRGVLLQCPRDVLCANVTDVIDRHISRVASRQGTTFTAHSSS